MLSAGRRAHQIWGRWEYHRIFGGKPPDEVNLGLETLASLGQWKNSYEVTPICRRSRISHEHNGHLWMENANFGVRNSSRPDARLIFRTGIIFQFVCKSKIFQNWLKGHFTGNLVWLWFRRFNSASPPCLKNSGQTVTLRCATGQTYTFCRKLLRRCTLRALNFPKKNAKNCGFAGPQCIISPKRYWFHGQFMTQKVFGSAPTFKGAGRSVSECSWAWSCHICWVGNTPTFVDLETAHACDTLETEFDMWLQEHMIGGLHMITYCRLISAL